MAAPADAAYGPGIVDAARYAVRHPLNSAHANVVSSFDLLDAARKLDVAATVATIVTW